jgi:hypothetical protein
VIQLHGNVVWGLLDSALLLQEGDQHIPKGKERQENVSKRSLYRGYNPFLDFIPLKGTNFYLV